jgi:hypothetical protein
MERWLSSLSTGGKNPVCNVLRESAEGRKGKSVLSNLSTGERNLACPMLGHLLEFARSDLVLPSLDP